MKRGAQPVSRRSFDVSTVAAVNSTSPRQQIAAAAARCDLYSRQRDQSIQHFTHRHGLLPDAMLYASPHRPFSISSKYAATTSRTSVQIRAQGDRSPVSSTGDTIDRSCTAAS